MRQSSVRGEGAAAQSAGDISGGGAGPSGTVPPPRGGSRRNRRAAGGMGSRRGRRRVLRWVSSVLAFLILGTAAAGYLYYRHLNGSIRTDALNLGENKLGGSKPNAFGQTPLNILLIGSDARNDEANQALGGATETFGGPPLADVQMLLHLSADRSNMSVVSMPRDTLLKMPKCTEPNGKVHPESKGLVQTNESLGRGGPGCTVAAWTELTKIPIDHFMMIDFKGVVSMADAIGGVPVCVEQNVHSRTRDGKGSGLKLPKGTTRIQGEQALQWLRTRYGFEDGTDIGRTHAQHQYMSSLSREFRKNAKLSNPLMLNSLAKAAIDAMIVDPSLNKIDRLYDLSMELKKVPPNRITMTTMPWVYSTREEGRVEPEPGAAEAVFKMVRDDVPLDFKGSDAPAAGAAPSPGASAAPTAPAAATTAPASASAPAKIAVSVRNATNGKDGAQAKVKNRAGEVASLLIRKGFTKTSSDTAASTSGEDTTVVRFADDAQAADAAVVATALGLPASSVEKSDQVSGITLFVGKDWRTGDAPAPPPPAPTALPTSAHALNGDNEGACMPIQPGFTW
ncbi:LCP family protein [Streptomyces sp. NPDC085524]|uniref:LCP family protein n=1 Tax=unclassified Streptomyces TaxID=2593676 RepID=UPI0035DF4EA5